MTDCEQFKGRLRDLCEGRGRDGRINPPQKYVDAFRQKHGITEWTVSQPSRGLGDVVKKITHATGIDKAVEYVAEKVTGKKGGCGCKARQKALNAIVPFAEPNP